MTALGTRLFTSLVVVTSVAAAGCGKTGKEEPTAATPSPATTPAPATTTEARTGDPAPHAAVAPPARDDHPVYSLGDNRLSAHLTRHGGLVVPAGSAGFAKYQRFGNLMNGAKRFWELRKAQDDIKVARIVNKTATMFVPVSADQAAAHTIRVRVYSEKTDSMSVKINDAAKPIASKIASGWSTVEVAVPANQLVAGENSIELGGNKSGLAVAWLEIGGDAPADTGEVAFYDASAQALAIPKAGAMTWFVAVPDHAQLAGNAAGCAIDVAATADDGTKAQGKLDGDATVDLSAVAGKAVRLDLSSSCSAKLASAALVLPGKQPEVKRGEPPKNVVFVVMDALRADRVKPWNPKARPDVPNFEKLAETSAVFLTDYDQGNESQVSHAAMWSSNYLAKHHAIEMSDKLADKWVTIDEVAKKANRYVAGASGNGYIRPSRGFGSAWDQFVNHIESEMGLKGADIIADGLSFVDKRHDQPWFVYLGLIDTHVTWRAKQPWMGKYDGGYKGRFATEYGDDGPNASDGKDLSDKEKDHVRALYDSNVSYQDDQMGKLVEKQQSWGVRAQTMLIITADHGDEQWEDGRVGHGGSERETLLHVPLLIHYPPMFPAARVTEGTENIDIVPTLADALGVEPDAEWQGASLVPLANGQGGYPTLAFSSMYENWHAGRIGHWKLKIQGPNTPKLYDLAADPDERSDVFAKSEVGARLMLDAMWMLRNWNVEWKKSQWGNAANVSSKFAADMGE